MATATLNISAADRISFPTIQITESVAQFFWLCVSFFNSREIQVSIWSTQFRYCWNDSNQAAFNSTNKNILENSWVCRSKKICVRILSRFNRLQREYWRFRADCDVGFCYDVGASAESFRPEYRLNLSSPRCVKSLRIKKRRMVWVKKREKKKIHVLPEKLKVKKPHMKDPLKWSTWTPLLQVSHREDLNEPLGAILFHLFFFFGSPFCLVWSARYSIQTLFIASSEYSYWQYSSWSPWSPSHHLTLSGW